MIAIKLYGANEQGVPEDWPLEVRENVEALPFGFDLLLEDSVAYKAYVAQRQASYDTWFAAQSESPQDRRAAFPDAEKYQVLDWLDDYGVTSADVETALKSIPDETQRRKALLRWHSVNRIPADNGFVLHVAKQLNIDHKTAWAQILAK